MTRNSQPDGWRQRLLDVEPDLSWDRQGVHSSVFVASNAVVVGNVVIGPESSLWFGVVVRGDIAPIRIGARTNIQDGAIVHADLDFPTLLGDDVTVGHGAIIHGATVANGCMIGMGAILLNGSHVGAEAIVGAGAVVTEGQRIPPRSLVLGVPGRVVRSLSDGDLEFARTAVPHYVRLARAYGASAWPQEPRCELI